MKNGFLQLCSQRPGHYLLLLVLGACLFLVNLGGPSLWDVDEGRNSDAASAMWETGRWVVPMHNGKLRVDKPALLYWLQCAAYSTCGRNEFSARLPSALAALVTVLLCYELGRRLFNPGSGLLAGLVVASTFMFCAAARFANPDALLNLFTVLTLLFFWCGYPRASWFWFVSLGASSGLAVLAKGPVGLIMPMAVMGLFLLWERRIGVLGKRRLLLGVLAFSAIALPWYILVAVETRGEFLRGFLLNHNIERFVRPKERHDGPLFYYLVVLVIGFAPWSIFLGLAAWYGGWSTLKRAPSFVRGFWERARDCATEELDDPDRTRSAYRFLVSWIAVYFMFFTLAATKLPNYILPIYVPLALLVGRFLDRWRRGLAQPPAWLMVTAIVEITLIGLIAAFGLLLAGGAIQLEFMHHHYVEGMERWAWMGLVPVVGGLAAYACLRKNQRGAVIACSALGIILFVGPMAAWALVTLNRHKAPQPLVELAGACDRQHEIRIGCWQLEYLPSLNFYCQREIIHHDSPEEAIDFLRSPLRVFLFVPEHDWHTLQTRVPDSAHVVGRHHDMYRSCQVLVVTNQ